MMRRAGRGAISLIVAAFIGWMVFAQVAPAEWWLDVRSVVIANTTTGVQPVMMVDRSINQPFTGTYTVDVEKKMPSGRYAVVCSARNSTNYRPDAELPEPLRLNWWTWPVTCAIEPGKYRVETMWRIEAPLFPDKVVSIMSNTFEVAD